MSLFSFLVSLTPLLCKTSQRLDLSQFLASLTFDFLLRLSLPILVLPVLLVVHVHFAVVVSRSDLDNQHGTSICLMPRVRFGFS